MGNGTMTGGAEDLAQLFGWPEYVVVSSGKDNLYQIKMQ